MIGKLLHCTANLSESEADFPAVFINNHHITWSSILPGLEVLGLDRVVRLTHSEIAS